jgi:beta-mannanase
MATVVYVLLLAGMATLALGLSTDPPRIGHADRSISKQGFLDAPGKWFGVTTQDAPGDVEGLRDFAIAAGKAPSIWMYWRDWSKPLTTHDIKEVSDQGEIPMIAWEPWTFGLRSKAAAKFSLHTITDGNWDSLIDASAKAVKAAHRLVIIRFAHEMNGNWYPWGSGVNGNKPGDYVAAWRHVWNRFQALGANKDVLWVWSPNNVRVTPTPLQPLYPGDRYVDLIGMSGFLGYGDISEHNWPDYQDSFAATTLYVREFTQKKFIISEMGALELGDIKEKWMNSVFDGIESNPDVIGFVWFNIDKQSEPGDVRAGPKVDWRITSSESSRRVFAFRVARGQYH